MPDRPIFVAPGPTSAVLYNRAAMSWWLWLLLGLVLSALELAAAGSFYLIFFGIGALFVGLLTLVHLIEAEWAQWLAFTVVSVSMLLIFRRPILRMLQPPGGDAEALVGEIATPLDVIAPGAVGRAELRGTAWSARNADTTNLAKGQRCRVQRVDGLTLILVPER